MVVQGTSPLSLHLIGHSNNFIKLVSTPNQQMQIIETQEMLFSFDSRVGDTLLSTPDHSGPGLISDQKLNSQETTSMKQKRHVKYVGVYYANHGNLGNAIFI